MRHSASEVCSHGSNWPPAMVEIMAWVQNRQNIVYLHQWWLANLDSPHKGSVIKSISMLWYYHSFIQVCSSDHVCFSLCVLQQTLGWLLTESRPVEHLVALTLTLISGYFRDLFQQWALGFWLKLERFSFPSVFHQQSDLDRHFMIGVTMMHHVE